MPRQTNLRRPASDAVPGATVGEVGPGVCGIRGIYLPILAHDLQHGFTPVPRGS